MAELGTIDQAAGLRRLFGNRGACSVAFAHVRRDAASGLQLARTASALAAQGQRIVIVDEHTGPGSITAVTGQAPRLDLFDVFVGDCVLADIRIPAAPGITVIPAARAAREFSHGEVDIAERMAACLAELGSDAAYVLVDGVSHQGEISPLAAAAQHFAVVLGSGGRSVTEAYALLKRQYLFAGRKEFQVVLAGIVSGAQGAGNARTSLQNLRATARKHLAVELSHLATLPCGQVDDLVDGLLTRLPRQKTADGGRGNVISLRALFGASGLFESVV